VVLEGRGPRTPGEVALGPSTEQRLDLHLGDRLELGPDAIPLTVVGTALFPSDVHSAFDEGAWLAPADYDATSQPEAGSRYLAVLRAIGMTRRESRLVLNVQGLAVFVVGLLLGIPFGVAAGRAAWTLLAERIPLDDVRPLAAAAMLLLVPATLLVSQVLALPPG